MFNVNYSRQISLRRRHRLKPPQQLHPLPQGQRLKPSILTLSKTPLKPKLVWTPATGRSVPQPTHLRRRPTTLRHTKWKFRRTRCVTFWSASSRWPLSDWPSACAVVGTCSASRRNCVEPRTADQQPPIRCDRPNKCRSRISSCATWRRKWCKA